jgi:hypothetical protein
LKELIGWLISARPTQLAGTRLRRQGYILLVSGENLGSRHQELTAQAAPDFASKND